MRIRKIGEDTIGEGVDGATITEEDFRKRVYDKYREHFGHTYALHQMAELAIQSYKSSTTSHYEASLSLIFGRAYKSYDSIPRLSEVASCEDTGVLLRSTNHLAIVVDPKMCAL